MKANFEYLVITGFLVSAALSSCTNIPPPKNHEPKASLETKTTPLLPDSFGNVQPPAPNSITIDEPSGVLSLRQALALTLTRSPDLAAFSWDSRISEARILQAGLRPNPVLDIQPQDITGSGNFRDGSRAETTLQLSQLIELGGKRSARLETASLAKRLSTWDYEIQRILVYTETAEDFLEVLREQRELELSEESVRLAQEVVTTVSTRVKAAATHKEEAAKAEVSLATAEIQREQSRRALVAARQQLATNWGNTQPVFTHLSGDLHTIPPIAPLEQLLEQLSQTPALARLATAIAHKKAALKLELTKAKPDITIGAGYRRVEQSGDNTMLLGVSIPLPFSNRNQGNILEAEYSLAKSRDEQRAAELHLKAALNQSYHELLAARSEVGSLKEKVLPGAQSVFETVSDHYRQGRYSYLEVLDAQRTLFSARKQLLSSLTDYHKSMIRIEQLLGVPVNVTAVTD